jgi:hypothetical protein
VTESRAIDFNLARRSGIVINRIISQIALHLDTLSGNETAGVGVQEVDVDPDNLIVEFAGDLTPEDLKIDSSRCLRHVVHGSQDTATGGADGVTKPHSQLIKDWSHMRMEERPISITSIRHHFGVQCSLSHKYQVEINIDYFIVELSLEELGIINASRR